MQSMFFNISIRYDVFLYSEILLSRYRGLLPNLQCISIIAEDYRLKKLQIICILDRYVSIASIFI